jgi:hypothetical protein
MDHSKRTVFEFTGPLTTHREIDKSIACSEQGVLKQRSEPRLIPLFQGTRERCRHTTCAEAPALHFLPSRPGLKIRDCMPEKPGPNFPTRAALAEHRKRDARNV